jgi:ABC-type polar amino acid transport system ATPase subunit
VDKSTIPPTKLILLGPRAKAEINMFELMSFSKKVVLFVYKNINVFIETSSYTLILHSYLMLQKMPTRKMKKMMMRWRMMKRRTLTEKADSFPSSTCSN